MKIYPEIEIEEYKNFLQIQTILRKEHNGVWYDWVFSKNYSKNNQYRNLRFTCDDKITLIQRFHNEVYYALILGIVDFHLLDEFGNKIYKKSESQQSEIDRLKQKLKIGT